MLGGQHRTSRFPTEAADQLPQPFSRSRTFFLPGLGSSGVCQLIRDFRKVDLKVVNKDIVHGVIASRLRVIEVGERRAVKGSSADVHGTRSV
jgi:hypothetical protein